MKIVDYPKHLRFPSKSRFNRPQSEARHLPPVSEIAVDLICRLVTYTDYRLSGVDDIKAHPFFNRLDWDNIHRQPSPWTPDLRSSDDLAQWFEPEKEIMSHSDDDKSREPVKRPRDKILRDAEHGPVAMEVRKQCAFLGYTFRRSELVVSD